MEPMTARLIDGKALATRIRARLRETVAGLPRPPGLAVVLVGDDPASQVYVGHKRRDCEEIGFRSLAYDLPAATTPDEPLTRIAALNADPPVAGILVPPPLPAHTGRRPALRRLH